MKDRIPTKPGRVKIIREDGTSEHVTLVRADEAKEAGTALNKETLLKDATAALYGLDDGAVPDDVFAVNAIGIGKYGWYITAFWPDGSPAADVKTNLKTTAGAVLTLDSNGKGFGITDSMNTTLSLTSPYFDITSISIPLRATSAINYIECSFSYPLTTERTFTSSVSITKWSPFVSTYDVCLVGGGGSGGRTGDVGQQVPRGSGGGGGFVTNKTNILAAEHPSVQIQVGSGGPKITGVSAGYAGGDTILKDRDSSEILAVANGGGGGPIDGTRASGNGYGGKGGKEIEYVGPNNPTQSYPESGGNAAVSYKYNDTSMPLSVSGGGGGSFKQFSGIGSAIQHSGGSPNGGKGSAVNGGNPDNTYPNYEATNGVFPGGGGGGGQTSNYHGTSPFQGYSGAGGNGIAYMRWRYKNK